MTRLLVSVRSVAEAEAALAGGAALIDVKEPAHGSLGRADDRVIAEVAGFVAGRLPVSAALGEFLAAGTTSLPAVLSSMSYVKWGLSGCGTLGTGWTAPLQIAVQQLRQRFPGCGFVAVAYADWERAAALCPDDVCDLACSLGASVLLLDTWGKDRTTLLDWLPPDAIVRLSARVRREKIQLALAGGLGLAQVRALLPLEPDWFAVRGAVCRGRQRGGVVERDRVRLLVDLLDQITPSRRES
jgi:(5-formylfuran-3-yl)methyl phosphate synthase